MIIAIGNIIASPANEPINAPAIVNNTQAIRRKMYFKKKLKRPNVPLKEK